jgi:hypothetical protein
MRSTRAWRDTCVTNICRSRWCNYFTASLPLRACACRPPLPLLIDGVLIDGVTLPTGVMHPHFAKKEGAYPLPASAAHLAVYLIHGPARPGFYMAVGRLTPGLIRCSFARGACRQARCVNVMLLSAKRAWQVYFAANFAGKRR